MKALTCEMCGSTNLIKEGGVFVCQSCGCKYTVEEAKKLQDTSDAISEADRQISQNRFKQYTQELAVAEKIAAIRATTEDSSYSFMD